MTACKTATGRLDPNEHEFVVAGTLNANGKAAGSATQQDTEAGLLVPISFSAGGAPSDVAVLKADASKAGDSSPHVQSGMQVRRLTPRECERLQGFPDDYTLIPYNGKLAADGPRYKALGNSMAVPVMAWIGKRIALVESL